MASSKRVLTDLDLVGHQLVNASFHTLNQDPEAIVDGQVYFNPTSNSVRIRQSGEWQDLITEREVEVTSLVKAPVSLATSENISIAGISPGVTIDGITLQSTDRLLVKDQTDPSENGIYEFSNGGAGPLTRTLDSYTTETLRPGSLVYVAQGTEFTKTLWVLDSLTSILIGTSPVNWINASALMTPISKGGTNNDTFEASKLIFYNETEDRLESSAFSANQLSKVVSYDITGENTSHTLEHNMSTRDVLVQLFNDSDGSTVEADVLRISSNEVRVDFNQAPGSSTYKVIIQGAAASLPEGVRVIEGGNASGI